MLRVFFYVMAVNQTFELMNDFDGENITFLFFFFIAKHSLMGGLLLSKISTVF